jgi:hypothetical protein
MTHAIYNIDMCMRETAAGSKTLGAVVVVLNDHRLAETNALPEKSFAPSLISTVYLVFGARSGLESNKAVLPPELRDMLPFMRSGIASFLTVNVFWLIVGPLICSVNAALMSEASGPSVAPSAGIVLSSSDDGAFSSADFL